MVNTSIATLANSTYRPHTMSKTPAAPAHHLELRVQEFAQLFNSMDPTPFLNKDLDREAEAFIETWALGFPAVSRLQITIHLEQMSTEIDPGAVATEAFHNFFNYRRDLMRRDLKQLLRQGRTSLVIGIAFVAACLIGAEAIGRLGTGGAITVGRESLTIVGWVAMWRPLQIFLYDWWPLARKIKVYGALRNAHVRVVQSR